MPSPRHSFHLPTSNLASFLARSSSAYRNLSYLSILNGWVIVQILLIPLEHIRIMYLRAVLSFIVRVRIRL